MKIYVGNKVVGEVNLGTFYKTVSGSKHFLRKPPAIAYDESVLEEVKENGAIYLEVFDKETGTTYETSLEYFLEKSFKFNRGFGDQRAMTLENWRVKA